MKKNFHHQNKEPVHVSTQEHCCNSQSPQLLALRGCSGVFSGQLREKFTPPGTEFILHLKRETLPTESYL